MSKNLVFVTRDIPRAGIELLEKNRDLKVVVRKEDSAPSRDELVRECREAVALLCLLSDPVDAAFLSEVPRLKVAANYAVGYDNIDVETAERLGIWVSNTPGVLTEATADLAFSLIMAAARRIVEADKFTRTGRFRGWEPRLLLGVDLHKKTIGIVGMGRIGQAVARRARGFSMKIIYHNRNRLPAAVEKNLDAEYADLNQLLKLSDILSLHVPGGDETRHLIGAAELELLGPGAVLVNTARGTVVDEEALADALEKRIIRAAGLDVFENEPEINGRLINLDNVVLAPHIGSATDDTRNRMAEMAAENILAALDGRRPPNAVNNPATPRAAAVDDPATPRTNKGSA